MYNYMMRFFYFVRFCCLQLLKRQSPSVVLGCLALTMLHLPALGPQMLGL